ncbi:FOG: FHA domain [Hahella chejuensis KCTC 2396]|uniref:FOG: FHA domain n=1 Tax=Hahella chejuensis (strain KCTC 2396) TaxID=349521 RepID=Q2S792_HAHCH|nr:FHA domain-containing protein [Hahella chejuensis]ABC33482.1 FOG: FHA domain [Hahella chejuensis KCTC 2396]
MLKLQFTDGSRESIWLVEPRLKIGKHSSNNLVLNQPDIQDFHAEIRLQEEQLYLLNLSPDYVVGVNGKKVQKAVKINENDTIQLGKARFKVVHPGAEHKPKHEAPQSIAHNEWGLHTNASWAKQSFYPIEDTVIIGRDEQCDITVPVSHLSRQHAQLTVAGNYMLVKDLGSTNGTYLNGERITQGRAKRGDRLRFDVVTFTVTGPEDDGDRTIVRPDAVAPAPSPAPTGDETVANNPPPRPARPAAPPKAARKPAQEKPAPAHEVAVKAESKSGYLLYTVIGFAVVFGALSAFFLLR